MEEGRREGGREGLPVGVQDIRSAETAEDLGAG